MANIIIIGNGPAGISTALYTTRAGLKTTIIGKDSGSLGKTSEIENYYGFIEPIKGTELVSNGIAQAKRLGTEFINDEVVGLSFEDKFVVTTKNESYKADIVVIATGSSRTAPPVKGLKELEGRGVSYCAVCDAFFYRGKDVAVLGHAEYALHEALELAQTSGSVTIITNGQVPTAQFPDDFKVITEPVAEFYGADTIESIKFKNGDSIDISGVFVAAGVAGSTDLARKIGAAVDSNHIITDENMSTNVPGLYAVGDCTGGLLQISKAVYEGAKAGTEIVKYIRNLSK